MSEGRLISKLFDFSFDDLAAKQIVKVGYVMYVAALVIVTTLVMGLTVASALERYTIRLEELIPAIAAPFVAILSLIAGRLFFELVVVLFNILDELRAQRQRWGG